MPLKKKPATAGKSGAANAHGMATSAAAKAGGRSFGKAQSKRKK